MENEVLWSQTKKGERTSVGRCPGRTCKIQTNTRIEWSNWIRTNMSEDKKEAVRAVGFGYTLQIGSGSLVQAIIDEMVHQIDPLSYKIRIHEVIFSINGAEFGRVMGIYDGDEVVEIGESFHAEDNGEPVLPMCNDAGIITRESLMSVVRDRNEADDTFIIAYVMLQLHDLVCPGVDNTVEVGLLRAVIDTNRIVNKKWATFAVRRLMDGVKRHLEVGTEIVTGCLLFLQLLYLDKVGEVVLPIFRSSYPVMYWTRDLIRELVEMIAKVGGHKAPTVLCVNSEKKRAFDNAGIERGPRGFKLKRSVHEDIKYVHLNVAELKGDMSEIKGEMKGITLFCQEFRRAVSKIDDKVSLIRTECAAKTVYTLGSKLKGEDVRREAVHPGSVTKSKLGSQATRDNTERYTPPGRQGKNIAAKASHAECDDICDLTVTAEEDDYRHAVMGKIGMQNQQKKRARFHRAGPFKLRTKLSESDVNVIKFVCMAGKNLTETEKSMCLGKSADQIQCITREELRCLMPGVKVSGSVINYVAAYLNTEGCNNWYWPTQFEVASKNEDGKSNSAAVTHTRKLCRLTRFDGRVGMCERIFIPFHEFLDGEGHWVVVVVDLVKKVAEVWDSLCATGLTASRILQVQNLLKHIDQVLHLESHMDCGGKKTVKDFIILAPNNAPIQTNAYDCGIHVIQNMQHYGTKWADQYDSDQQRAAILLDCVRSPNNNMASEIAELSKLFAQSGKKNT